MTFTDAQIRAAAIEAAEDIWRRPVLDPEDYDAVTRLFRENGWPTVYVNQPGAEYCGHTYAVAWRRIGDYLVPGQCIGVSIHPELAKKTLVSTTRLSDRGPKGSRWRDHGFERPAVDDIQPGDLVVVVTSAGKEWGDHITMALTEPENGVFKTFEGNAVGARGDGSWGKGVCKRTRQVKDVRQILRLGAAHCVGL